MRSMNQSSLMIFTALLLITFLGGCAGLTGDSYTSKQTRSASRVYFGTIRELSPAYIENDPSMLGTLGGAVVGGVAGSTLGGGRGRVLTTLGGAVLGAIVGTGIEKAVTNRDGLEIVVELDNGETLAIVQALGPEEKALLVGDKVRVMRGADGSARVRR